MNKKLALALVFVSVASFAKETKEIKNIISAQPVRVMSVDVKAVGEHGWPQTAVVVKAQFGNPCQVPSANELVSIVEAGTSFAELNISLGDISRRACPAVYMPVVVEINLGVHTRPNDGLFEKITVNGVDADLSL